MPPRPKSKRPTSLPVAIEDHKQVATRPVMLLVLGPHRSGTSLTTRLLECLGAKNAELQLGAGGNDNPRGFFEAMEVLEFNDTVLTPRLQWHWSGICPVDWTVLNKLERSRLGLKALEIIRRNYPLSNPLSVLKEPRINNTLPFWLSLLEHAGFDVRFVCSVRDPVSMARSLAKRDGLSIAHSSMINLNAWLSVLPHLQDRQVAFVQFDEIFVTPGKALARVADKLGLTLPLDFDQRLHEFTSQHLDPALRHSSLPREDVMFEPDLPPLVAELYRVLLDAAQSQNIRKTAKFVAYAERQIENVVPLLADYDAKQSKLSSLKTEYDNAQTECAHLQSQLTDSTQQSQTAVVAERDAVTAERDALAARVSSLESAHSSLSTLHSSLVAERDELSTLHSSLIAERDDLATRHTSLATEREALQGHHSSLSTLHSSLVAERDDLATRLSAFESEHSELATRNQQLATALESLQSQHSSLSTLHPSLIAERDSLVQERDTLAQERSQLAAERDALAGRLAALESDHSSLFTTHSSLVTDHSSLSTLHSSLVAERDALARERDQLGTRLIKLEREYQMLIKSERSLKLSHRKLEDQFARASAALSLLQNAQDEAVSLRTSLASLQTEKADVAKDRDRLTARISTLEAEHAKLATRHKSLVTALEQLQGQHSSLVAERDELIRKRETLAAELSALNTSRTIDSSRLRQYIGDTATLARKLVACEDIAQSWQGASTITKIAEVTRTHTHSTGDHKHLDYILTGISCSGRCFSPVEARIVQHLGNPGLAVLQQNASESAFSCWREDGTENGRGYMLIIPSDKKGTDWLSQAATTDLLLFRGIVSHIKADLVLHKDAYWINVCSSILHSVSSLPPRIHYDALEVISVSKRITRALLINPSHRMTLFPNHIVTFDKNTITHIDVEHSPLGALERTSLSHRSLIELYKLDARSLLRAIHQPTKPKLRLPFNN